MNNKTLLIIPCCKTKIHGGNKIPNDYQDPLIELISGSQYLSILETRKKLYSYLGNKELFMPAIDRYVGYLYKSIPNFANCIKEKTNGSDQPKLIILSALYGPLHPKSLINNYELKMPTGKNSLWHINFPSFLQNYVNKNKIKSIRIYCGLRTGYYSVLSKAIEPLLETNSLTHVLHYNIDNGNSYHTPHNHGLQLALDLSCVNANVKFTKKVELKYLQKG